MCVLYLFVVQVDLAKADIKAAKAEAKSQKKARQKIEKEISELAEAVSIERAQFTDRAREHEAAKVIARCLVCAFLDYKCLVAILRAYTYFCTCTIPHSFSGNA